VRPPYFLRTGAPRYPHSPSMEAAATKRAARSFYRTRGDILVANCAALSRDQALIVCQRKVQAQVNLDSVLSQVEDLHIRASTGE